jgi:hypothetical protein
LKQGKSDLEISLSNLLDVLSDQAPKPLCGAPKGAGLDGESADRAIIDGSAYTDRI